MPYDKKKHTENHCDRCLKKVGKENLKPFPFLYMAKDDNVHPDMSNAYDISEPGYRQYYGCPICIAMEERIAEAKKKEKLKSLKRLSETII